MAGSTPRQKGIKDRVLGELKRDPKKAVILGLLFAVLAIIGGVELARRMGPATAGAAVARTGGAAEPRTTRPGGETPSDGTASATEGAEQPGRPIRALSPVVDRDLFTPNPALYPLAQAPKAAPKMVTPVEDPAAQEMARRQAIVAQAQALTLQSTVIGAVPTAIINGQVLRTGEEINGFEVVRIDAHCCVVEKEGLQVALEMSK
ncbi:MAG TPA: hypothetical protein VM695_08410 [Phycisphaerae bacterium]|nr:hypothetical protein [Phycisphaerae bacterium]